MTFLALPLAAAREPLFGNQWLALIAILACTAALMVAVASVGRWLAATHPAEPVKPAASAATPAAAEAGPGITSPETLAIIAACVVTTFGRNARITQIRTGGPSVEMLMQQWSLEGRRQIYSSHQIR